MTGSVRDYFYDNSDHIFDPSFDIVGPVDVNYASTYPQSTAHADEVFHAALNAADSLVNFSDYDTDGDGYVDMVFFLVAGYSANYSGNDQSLLWPHMYYLFYEPVRDNVRFGLYACSTEMAGLQYSYHDVNGIETFCHEFGHVLGLPDLYDTDYNGSGGQSQHPGGWSIMAGGGGDFFGRSPVGYSLYERYSLNFTTPRVLDTEGQYTLPALDEENWGYRLNTSNPDEYFLLENRQAGKWDKFLPGRGMIIARVDSSNVEVWQNNQVTVNPDHVYFELLRAFNQGHDSDSDPFPGTAGVTEINNFTTPNLLTWDGSFNPFGIKDIALNDGLISFNLYHDSSIKFTVEDFEDINIEEEENTGVQGKFTKWDFVKCRVTEAGEGNCNGLQAVAMKKPSQFTSSSTLRFIPYTMSLKVYNPTSTDANFRLTYSTDNGATWLAMPGGTFTAKAKSSTSASATLPTDKPVMVRVAQVSGNAKSACYVDDINFYYVDMWGDMDRDGEITIGDINTAISAMMGDEIDSQNFKLGDMNCDGEINISDINAIINLILSNN